MVINSKKRNSLFFDAKIVAHDDAKIEYVTFLHISLKRLENVFICPSKKVNVLSASSLSTHCLPVRQFWNFSVFDYYHLLHWIYFYHYSCIYEY